MLGSRTFDELAARIGQALENSPAKDIEKNVKSLLASGLARLDVVPRSEFDVQAQVLLRTREKLEALELRLGELEARLARGAVPISAGATGAGPMSGTHATGGTAAASGTGSTGGQGPIGGSEGLSGPDSPAPPTSSR